MAVVHVAFGAVGGRGRAGTANLRWVSSDSPRVAENVTTSTTTAYTLHAAARSGECVSVTVPSSASVWVAVDAAQAGTLDVDATNAWRVDGPGTAHFFVNAGDGLAIEDVV